MRRRGGGSACCEQATAERGRLAVQGRCDRCRPCHRRRLVQKRACTLSEPRLLMLTSCHP